MFEYSLKILRVEKGASPEALREAYVKMVRRYPPEHFPEKFAAVKRAYNRLRADDSVLEECLDSSFLRGNAAELAGLLWGELPELHQETTEIDFTLLASLLDEDDRKNALDAALTRAAAEGVDILRNEDEQQ